MTAIFAVVATLAAVQTPAPTPKTARTPAVPPTVRTAAKSEMDVVCRDVETPGTRLGRHKQCMTRWEWREQDAQIRMSIRLGQLKGYRH